MNIHEIKQKIKPSVSWKALGEHLLLGAIVAMVGLTAFGLGRLSVLPGERTSPDVQIVTPSGNLIECH